MNTTTRTLIAIPLAAAALSAGATPVMAETVSLVSVDFENNPTDPDPDPGPQIPGDKQGPNGGDSDDDDDDDRDDSDDDDDDDRDDSDDDDREVRRPTRVDAGADSDLSLAWLLAGGAMVTAVGGFTARKAALKQR